MKVGKFCIVWIFLSFYVCFFLFSFDCIAKEYNDIFGYVEKYHADGYVVLDRKEDCVNYIHDAFVKFKGVVILYSGGDYMDLTLDSVDELVVQSLQYDDIDSLCDGAELWGNIHKYYKGLVKTSNVTIICLRIEYKHTKREQDLYFEEIEKILHYLEEVKNIYNLSDVEKIQIVHDYLCNRFDYDKSYTNYTGYDALFNRINGKEVMVCQGYSLMAYQMLNRLKIETNILVSENHSWNIVKIDNKWYHLDITNDDRGIFGDQTIYKYFLKKELKGKSYEYYKNATFYNIESGIEFAQEDYPVKFYELGRIMYIHVIHASQLLKDNAFTIFAIAILIILVTVIINGVEKWMKIKIIENRKRFRLYNSI